MYESKVLLYFSNLTENENIKKAKNYVCTKYQNCKQSNEYLNSLILQTEKCATQTIKSFVPIACKSINLSAKIVEPIIGKIENPG